MKTFIDKYGRIVLGIVIGSIAGWSYWYFVGCASGTCPITSKPLNSTLYGAFMGGLLASLFKKENKPQNNQQQ